MLKLSPKGAVRWFAKCCNTPIANTISLKMSFHGVLQNFIDFKSSDLSKGVLIGPLEYRCMGKYGTKNPPEGSHEKFSKILFFKIIKTTFLGKITKSYLPNSFFNEKTGLPISQTILLSKEEKNSIVDKINNN